MNPLFGATVEVRNSEYKTSSYIVQTEIICWTSSFNTVISKLINPLFQSCFKSALEPLISRKIRGPQLKMWQKLQRNYTKQESHKMLNNMVAIEYKYPSICIDKQYMVIKRIPHRTKILIIPWLNIAPYGHKCM